MIFESKSHVAKSAGVVDEKKNDKPAGHTTPHGVVINPEIFARIVSSFEDDGEARLFLDKYVGDPPLESNSVAERNAAVVLVEHAIDGQLQEKLQSLKAQANDAHVRAAREKLHARRTAEAFGRARSQTLLETYRDQLAACYARLPSKDAARDFALVWAAFNETAKRQLGAPPWWIHLAVVMHGSDDRIGDPLFVKADPGDVGEASYELSKTILDGAGPAEILAAVAKVECAIERAIRRCRPNAERAQALRSTVTRTDFLAPELQGSPHADVPPAERRARVLSAGEAADIPATSSAGTAP